MALPLPDTKASVFRLPRPRLRPRLTPELATRERPTGSFTTTGWERISQGTQRAFVLCPKLSQQPLATLAATVSTMRNGQREREREREGQRGKRPLCVLLQEKKRKLDLI